MVFGSGPGSARSRGNSDPPPKPVAFRAASPTACRKRKGGRARSSAVGRGRLTKPASNAPVSSHACPSHAPSTRARDAAVTAAAQPPPSPPPPLLLLLLPLLLLGSAPPSSAGASTICAVEVMAAARVVASAVASYRFFDCRTWACGKKKFKHEAPGYLRRKCEW